MHIVVYVVLNGFSENCEKWQNLYWNTKTNMVKYDIWKQFCRIKLNTTNMK